MDILGLTLRSSYGDTITVSDSAVGGVFGLAFGTAILMFFIGLIVGCLLKMAFTWGIYKKAGYKGWEGLIPFYGDYIMCKIAGVDTAFFVLGIFFNIIYIYVYIKLAEKFKKEAIWGVGLYFLSFIFMPILGYGEAKYVGDKKKAGK